MNLRAVVFDISGTVLDYGSRAPVRAFVELFRRHGVALTEAEARRPMGAEKRDHIAALLADSRVAARWSAAGVTPDLDALYQEFIPLQQELVLAHADVIPGVPALVAALRERGFQIANTTGFSRAMVEPLIPLAAANGYVSDAWVCPDDVGGGRPAPWMMYEATRRLNVYPMKAVVKVGDTPFDIAEARAAGAWAVAVVRHGNEVGLSAEEWEALPPNEQQSRLASARHALLCAQPHYIIEQTVDLLPVLDAIEVRLQRARRP